MPTAQTRAGLHSSKQPGRQLRANSASKPSGPKCDRIRVRVWPRRGIGRAEESVLASELTRLRADQRWDWEGTDLVGEMCTDAELTDGDVVDHLCALQSQADLARIDLSHPYSGGQRPAAWLRVRQNHPELPVLCALYCDRLLTAESVIRALGGFVCSASEQTWPDDG